MLSKLESRKECMEQIELIQHWNYFCSLAERLDDTKHYIDHGLQEHDGIRELVHGKVYSDIFKQIIVLAASEFEIMSKALCSAKGVKTKRIGDISETILGVFPKIIDFEVSTPFWINTPLHDWKTTRIDNGKNVKVEGLLDCYKKLPLNEEKLCCYGMRLFYVSNLADSIGDNRFSSEVDRELLEDAVKLGYKYCNALFELKNTPKDLVYWRMKVLDSLYCNIDLISDDSELIALYRLTNSWIKEYIENDREYNRLETLRSYNYEIISRISSSEIREKLMAKGLYDKAEHKDFSVETGRDYNLEIINLLKEDGYNEKAEGVILTQIDKREIGLHKLIMEAGDIIAQKHMEEYVNRCVVKFILSESKYGYIGSGISDVFERYYEMFNDNTWNLLFENIVTRFAESDYGIIASLWGDFTIFSIYYLSRIDKDKIKALFDCLCKTHESLSSANGRVKIKEEKLILDENITSLSDMVNFQLNI